MIRVTPARVKITTSVPTSCGRPRCERPPWPAYSPSEFSRTITQSSSLAVDLAQGAGDPGQDAGRADVGVLVERLADREPQAPQRDVVGHVRGAHGAEVERVEAAQLLVPAGRHHDAVLLVVVRAPVEVGDVELEAAVALGAGLEHLEATRFYIWL